MIMPNEADASWLMCSIFYHSTCFRVVVQAIFFYYQSMVEREPGDGSERYAPIQFGEPLTQVIRTKSSQ
jgi:hypothetical protein